MVRCQNRLVSVSIAIEKLEWLPVSRHQHLAVSADLKSAVLAAFAAPLPARETELWKLKPAIFKIDLDFR
jgi:hypothetical protein